jgi:prepilin-type N-terminal cleavage/methylation domain-containing protein
VKRTTAGFTLVEVLVAVVVLAIGIIAMAGTSGMVTRMIGRGKMATRTGQVATQKMEQLRLAAYSTSPRCTAGLFASGGPEVTAQGVTRSWVVPASGKVRTVTVTVSFKTPPGGTHTDVLNTLIEC